MKNKRISSSGTITLHERGDDTPIIRHPNFRLFACMNPSSGGIGGLAFANTNIN